MNNTRENTTKEKLIDLAEQAKDEGDISQFLSLCEEVKIKEKIEDLNKPETHPDFNGKNCIDCGYEIPPKRLILEKIRCIDCQEEYEEYLRRQNIK